MLQGIPAKSSVLTLDEVIARLSKREAVDGVLVIGSASAGTLTAASDYDLVIVLTAMPKSLDPFGVTYIDGRLTDLIFVTTEQLDEVGDLETAVGAEDWPGRILRWSQIGTIAFDRSNRLKRVQKKAQEQRWVKPQHKSGPQAWRSVNYNLAQSKRLLKSDDVVYLLTADLRLALYGVADLLFNYFHIRKIQWAGEKAAVRYLLAHDPPYWELLKQFMRETDRERKLALYEELAALTVAPVGDLWAEGTTVLGVSEPSAFHQDMGNASAFWEELLKE